MLFRSTRVKFEGGRREGWDGEMGEGRREGREEGGGFWTGGEEVKRQGV